jgi:hypothetical protein
MLWSWLIFILSCCLNIIFSQPCLQSPIFILLMVIIYWRYFSLSFYLSYWAFNFQEFCFCFHCSESLCAEFLIQVLNWFLYFIHVFNWILFELIDAFESKTLNPFQYLWIQLMKSYEVLEESCCFISSYFLCYCIVNLQLLI